MTEDERRTQLRQDYLFTFSTDQGQRVLEDLRRAFGDRLSYVEGDPHTTSFNEGARSVYLKISALMTQARDSKKEKQRVAETSSG